MKSEKLSSSSYGTSSDGASIADLEEITHDPTSGKASPERVHEPQQQINHNNSTDTPTFIKNERLSSS